MNQETDRQTALMHSFWELQRNIMSTAKQTAADNDLSMPQFGILMLMQRKKQIPQKQLQARTHYPKSTLSHAIEGLVQAGFLIRTHVEGNRREMDLSLSEQGKELLKKIKKQEDGVHCKFKNAVNSFTEEQFTALLEMHKQISTFFEGGDSA